MTEAGKRLLDALTDPAGDPEIIAGYARSNIAAIEAEAIAAERARIVAGVEGLGWNQDSDGWYCDECHTTSRANGHLAHCPYTAVLRIIEGGSE